MVAKWEVTGKIYGANLGQLKEIIVEKMDRKSSALDVPYLFEMIAIIAESIESEIYFQNIYCREPYLNILFSSIASLAHENKIKNLKNFMP